MGECWRWWDRGSRGVLEVVRPGEWGNVGGGGTGGSGGNVRGGETGGVGEC